MILMVLKEIIILLYYDKNYYSYQMFLKIDLFLKCNKYCCNIELNTSILYIELFILLFMVYIF